MTNTRLHCTRWSLLANTLPIERIGSSYSFRQRPPGAPRRRFASTYRTPCADQGQHKKNAMICPMLKTALPVPGHGKRVTRTEMLPVPERPTLQCVIEEGTQPGLVISLP